MKRIINFLSPILILGIIFAFMVGFKEDTYLSSAEKQDINLLNKKEEKQAENQDHKEKSSNSVDEKETYTVKSGDTLTEISKKFDESTSSIVAWNNIDNPDHIKESKTLVVSE